MRIQKWYATKPENTAIISNVSTSNVNIGDVDLLHTMNVLANVSDSTDPFLNLLNEDIPFDVSARSGFKPKSVFLPQIKNDCIDVFERGVTHEFAKLSKKKYYKTQNITKNQREAIQSLKNDPNIIIKKSDKGGNVVVMPKDMYINEGMRQLNDKDRYRLSNRIEYEASIKTYQNKLNSWKEQGLIEKEHNFLLCRFPKLPALYLLPKIHKNNTDPPGRPIVSSIGSCMENTSKYVDFFL